MSVSHLSSVFFPAVSVMGFARPSTLLDANVSSFVLPAHSSQIYAPKIRFNNFMATMGMRESESYEPRTSYADINDFDGNASDNALVRLASRIFSAERPHAPERGARVLDGGIGALAGLHEAVRCGQMKKGMPGETDWFTGGRIFLNVGGDPDLSLIAMCAVGKAPLVQAAGEILNLSLSLYSDLEAERLPSGRMQYKGRQSDGWIVAG